MRGPKPSLIYFVKPVGLDGPIKIGCSSYPADRLLSLAAWSPFPLELIGSVPGTLKDEFFLHQCFADLHSHREWFHAQPRLIHVIKTALQAGSLDGLRELKPQGSIRTKRREATDDERRRYSYSHRVRLAEARLRKQGVEAWYGPADFSSIFDRWRDNCAPSAAEMARLNEYLADPAAHSRVPPWQKLAVVA